MNADNLSNAAMNQTSSSAGLWFIKILGRDRDCVLKCAEDEHFALIRQGIAYCYSAMLAAAGCAAGLLVGEFHPAVCVAIGVAYGLGIFLFDSIYGLSASNDAVRTLAFGAQQLGGKERLKPVLFAVTRLTIAICSALFVSTFTLLILFADDAEAHRLKTEELDNRVVVDKYQAIVADEHELRIKAARIEAATEEQEWQKRQDLAVQIDVAEKEMFTWEAAAYCERFGVAPGNGCPEGVSEEAGLGKKYEYAVERGNILKQKLKKFEAELQAIPTESSHVDRKELEAWIVAESGRAMQLAKLDPDYIAAPATLLYRIKSLWQLVSEDSILLAVVLFLKLLSIGLDTMGMQIAGSRRRSPGQYEYMKAGELLNLEAPLREQRAHMRLDESRLVDNIEQHEHAIVLRRFARKQWHQNWLDTEGLQGSQKEPANNPDGPMH